MESQLYSLLRQPLTKENLDDDLNVLPIDADRLQLQVDTLNVLEKRVNINTFSESYQKKIKDYYRFSATRMRTDVSKIAKRTPDTLDLV